jgi:hypothetical protein
MNPALAQFLCIVAVALIVAVAATKIKWKKILYQPNEKEKDQT